LSARRSEPPIRTEMMRPEMRPKMRTVFFMGIESPYEERCVRARGV
jgi:hypothetical protein